MSSATNLQDARSRIVMAVLTYAISAVSVALFLWILCYVVTRLNVGVDVSDSAYYIISYAMHQDIEAQSTLAGWIWAALSPFDGILANRYLGTAFILICFGSHVFLFRNNINFDIAAIVTSVSISLSGAMIYYRDWLPDPSYNSVNLGLISIFWIFFFRMHGAALASGANVTFAEFGWASGVGAAMIAVVLSKATSAVPLSLVALALYLGTAWRTLHTRRLIVLVLACIFGCMIVLLMLAANGESPIRVIRTMQGGYRLAMAISNSPFNPVDQFHEFIALVTTSPLLDWKAFAVLAVVFLAVGNSFTAGIIIPFWVRSCLSVGVAVAIPVIVWQSNGFEALTATLVALIALAAGFSLSGILILPRKQRRSFLLFWAAMVTSLFIYVYGTGGRWDGLVASAGGFTFSALALTLQALQSEKRVLLAIPSLSLVGMALVGTARGVEYTPSRLTSPMSELTSIACVGPLDEQFLDSPTQALFYNKLRGIRPLIKQLPERPYLIDLSGRAPMVALQIGAKPPHTPWLLSGYPGSDRVIRLVLRTISSVDLKHAWIFQAYAYEAHFPDAILDAFGINFPEDYHPIATVPIEYLGVNGTIYAPKIDIGKIYYGSYLSNTNNICKHGEAY